MKIQLLRTIPCIIGIFSFIVVHAQQSGTLDSSFGNGGKVITDIGIVNGSGTGNDHAWSVAIQNDGKIVVAGHTHNTSMYDFAVVRYNNDGSLDTTFDDDGKVTTDFGLNDYAYSVAIQNNGKIVVAGDVEHSEFPFPVQHKFGLSRYNSDGSLDSTFGTDGKVITRVSGSGACYGRSVAIQSDGKIVVAGNSAYVSHIDFALVRYNSDGSLDTTFGSNGEVTTNIPGYGLFSMVIQKNDGKILVSGGDFTLARYNSDGSLDTTFDSDGIATVSDFGGPDNSGAGNLLTIQNDGKIVSVGGYNDGFALVRFNSDGTLDTSFDFDGKVITEIGVYTDVARSVAIHQDGRIIVAGRSGNGLNYDFAVACYNNDGSLDTTFGTGGKVTTSFGGYEEYGNSVAIQSDGKVVVAGLVSDGSFTDFALARYNAVTLGVGDNALANNTLKVYPNPFSGTATVSFSLNESEKVSLKIFDLNGRSIKSISENFLAAGSHSFTFDGEQLNSGIYLLQLKGESFSKTEKLVFAK
ncbi:T9SS type A sorting domain-containing protein [Flavobacterium pedocola]